ncbi:50S ribosomal protein L22 [Candidatus Microgenomates bacterium]|jgi:large subunit ribosomal protein L22|nr:50S ribosomal protein L22 [Candidatus Microgenomates bacterium]
MEEKIVKVKVNNIAESPLKLRLVADVVRGKRADEALNLVELVNKKGSLFVKKALLSGIANARDLFSVDKEDLIVKSIFVDGASTLKRTKFNSRGRVSRIDKRRSNLNLELKVK